jgi:LuxR family maltose regulon positive regulatory protein
MLRSGAAAPAALPGVVARASLLARLSAAGGRAVTLVSAPAGSGKTVLLGSWIAAEGLASRTAWVTVDRGEHDAQRFWLLVVEALRAIRGVDDLVERRTAIPEFDGQAFVDRLTAELERLSEPIILVIDDLHELAATDAQRQLETLLARRPPHLRVILATRHDPQLGLHRLRLAGELAELRGADLRFTAVETSELLTASGIAVSDETAARLQERTEGWAAGLRLAALSLAGRRDTEQFVAEFSGSERTVADYLLAEVLERQPEAVRILLLRTSILDRVSGPLADRLLGTPGSERILLALDATNAFVAALDAERAWFRYHQLFADLLRLELRRTSPELLPTLHRAAAEWYVEHGQIVDAVRHLQSAEDWASAARLLAEHGPSLLLDGHAATVDTLLAALPPQAHDDPEVLALLAYRELSGRSRDAAADYLLLAERRADATPPEARYRVTLALASTRLALARRRGDLDTALLEAGPLLEPVEARTPRELVLGGDARAVALMNLAIVELWSSRLPEAERHLEEALALAREIERPFVEIACLSYLGLLESRSSFARARARCEEALQVAEAHGWAADPVAGMALAALASMDAAQGRFDDARTRLERATPLLRDELDPAGAMFVHFVQGDVHAGEGQFAEAVEALRSAERIQRVLATRTSSPGRYGRPSLDVRAGDTTAAHATLAALGDDERDGAEARLALAALRLVDDAPAEAIATLDEILSGAVPILRLGIMVQALVVAAAARHQLGDATKAAELIEHALDLAEPDGLVLPFVTTPAPGLVELLERHPRHETVHAALLSDLIDVLRDPRLRSARADRRPRGGPEQQRAAGPAPAEQLVRQRDRRRALRLDQHRQDTHAPHLRQARHPPPDGGRGSSASTRAARAIDAAASLTLRRKVIRSGRRALIPTPPTVRAWTSLRPNDSSRPGTRWWTCRRTAAARGSSRARVQSRIPRRDWTAASSAVSP